MSADLFDRVKDAAAKTNLTIANTMRLAMERGLEKVVEQLTSQPS